MTAGLSFLAALFALFSTAGCVVSGGAGKSNLPPDWAAALPKSGAPTVDLAGEFVELGEQLDARFSRDGTVSRANLSTFLDSKTLASQTVRRPPDGGATVELRRTDDTHVELITKVRGEVTHRASFEIESEKDTGTILLHRGESLNTGGEFLAAAYVAYNFRLWRATDGRLYAHGTRRAIGEAMLVPVMFSAEVWCRWDPATPEAMARQAAVLAQQVEAGQRAVELNRQRANVGATAPAFAGMDVVTGRPITNADYAGKVVVVHVWSTGTLSTTLKPLRACYEANHARGLEMIGLCRSPAEEREKVVDFIKSHDLTWPQFYDGKGIHCEMFEAFYGTLPPRFCVIDRHGIIVALVASTKDLDAAVATALAAP